jgi:hypothetical protein
MKTLLLRYSLIFVALFMVLSSCDPDDAPTPSEKKIGELSKTWIVDQNSLVMLDDKDITTDLVGFEITIDDNLNYTTNGSEMDLQPLPWPSSGLFELEDNLTELIRDDGLLIDISGSTDEELHLQFLFAEEFDDSSGGRISAVEGSWVFIMSLK